MNLFASPTSHQKLAFTHERLFQVLKATGYPQRDYLSPTSLTAEGVVNKMQDAFPVWARAMGLLERVSRSKDEREPESGSWQLTDFGREILKENHDPSLRSSDSLWLLHYHMASPIGPGFAFLNDFFGGRYQQGNAVPMRRLAEDLVQANEGTRLKSLDHARGHAVHILKAYTQPSWPLGRLKMVETASDVPDSVRLLAPPTTPSVWVFAYALVDQWQRGWGDGNVTVALDRLYETGGIANILFLPTQTVEKYLAQLDQEGWLNVFRIAPPFQLARRWEDADAQKAEALRRVYEE